MTCFYFVMRDRYVIVCRFGEGAVEEESKGGKRKNATGNRSRNHMVP
jgi:hypothetical protein